MGSLNRFDLPEIDIRREVLNRQSGKELGCKQDFIDRWEFATSHLLEVSMTKTKS